MTQTPKEKAIELYKKYEFVYIQNYTSKYEVIQCALICVDELIESWDSYLYGNWGVSEFWQEVKNELNKM